MAIREVVATSPLSNASASRVATLDDLARDADKKFDDVKKILSIVADWVEHRYRSVTAAYTVDNETVILADATGGAFAITLPPSNTDTINRDIHIKRLNAGANAVTVTASAGNTIDGAATNVLAVQYASIHIVADGLGAWHII